MGIFDDAKSAFNRGTDWAGEKADDALNAVHSRMLETSAMAQGFGRVCTDAFNFGWHEANGGNLSYLLDQKEADECAPCLSPALAGSWEKLGFEAEALKGRLVLITASGCHMRDVARDLKRCAGLIEIGAEGDEWRPVWGFEDCKPTSELQMHLRCLNAGAQGGRRVLYHAHPENCIALTMMMGSDGAALTRCLWSAMAEAVIAFPKGLAALGWMVPGTPELGQAVCEQLEHSDAVLLANHGIVCAGPSLKAAFGLCHTVEKAAGIRLKCGLDTPGITPEGIRQIVQRYSIDADLSVLD